MITSEQAFDMLPYAVDIFDKLSIKEYAQKQAKKAKGKTDEEKQENLGMDIVKYIIKNSGKVKEEFFNMVAIAEYKKVEEVKKQGIVKTIKIFEEIFNDTELMDFFRRAMQ